MKFVWGLGGAVGSFAPVPVDPMLTRRACVNQPQVWTLAQVINFKYVPPAYRVLFGA